MIQLKINPLFIEKEKGLQNILEYNRFQTEYLRKIMFTARFERVKKYKSS